MQEYQHTSCFLKTVRSIIFLLFCCISVTGFSSNYSSSGETKSELRFINFVQNTIDVSHSNQTVYFSLRACSQEILSKAVIYFESPSGKEQIQTSCVNKKKTKLGFFIGRVLFKKKSEIGIWKISQIIIEDSQGQQTSFDKNYLIDKNLSYSLRITNNSSK